MLATLPSLDEIQAEKARRHLRDFTRQAWPLVEPGTPLVWNWHLDAIFEHLEAVTAGQIRNLLINVPPGHMKSLAVSVFWPAWVWIRRPEWRAIFSSYAESLALRDSVKTRIIVSSDWYQRRFVNARWALSGDQNVKGYFQNTRMGFRMATGVGGAGTGLRGDAIVVDDPLKATDAFSKAKREEVLRWWDQEMANRVSDPRTGVRVVIMQRLHEKDLSGHILSQGGWEHLCLPSEFETKRRSVTCIGWTDPRKEEGDLLFPEMFSRETLAAERKRLGTLGYPGQHQQRPTPASGGMFKNSWWRFWRHSWEDPIPEFEDRTVVLPTSFDEWAISVDCAFKGNEENDRVAAGVWARAGANKYLIDLRWDQMTFTRTCEEVQELASKYPQAVTKFVEDKANGPAVVNTLQDKVEGLIEVSPEGGKEARAAATSPQVEAGNVFIPLHPEWRDQYIEEHTSFPRGAHDDVVDQQSQLLLRWSTHTPPIHDDLDRTDIYRGRMSHAAA